MSFLPLCFFLVYLTKQERASPRQLLGLATTAFALIFCIRRSISRLESSRMLISVGYLISASVHVASIFILPLCVTGEISDGRPFPEIPESHLSDFSESDFLMQFLCMESMMSLKNFPSIRLRKVTNNSGLKMGDSWKYFRPTRYCI